jgi:hypothetical protein
MNNRKPIFVVMFILSTLILNACVQAAGKAPVDGTTFTNEKFGYTLKVPADCFIGRMPVYCKASPPEERPHECLCFLDGENPDQVRFNAFTGEPIS